MKFPYLFLFFGLFFSSNFAQTLDAPKMPPQITAQRATEPCNIKISALPEIRGLVLGMRKSEVQKEYPSMKIKDDPVRSFGTVMAYQISNPDYAENIDRIHVMFKNEQVFSVLITYSDLVPWDSAEQFADKISKSLNLPKARERKGDGGIFYSVNCGTFLIRTRINKENQPTLFLTKDPSEMWESTQQKRDNFKP